MFVLNERDREYRHGDHGPKYLEEGPEIAFGIMKFLPGQAASGHLHQKMQETFFVLEGEFHVELDGQEIDVKQGDYLHLAPGEKHAFSNRGSVAARMVIVKAPYVEGDKVASAEPGQE